MALDDPRMTITPLLPNVYHRVSTTPAPTDAAQLWREGAAMSVNEELVASGLRVLRDPLSVFVCQGIEKHFGDTWWTDGVLQTLVTPQTSTVDEVRRYRHLPEGGTVEECAASLDIAVCLILLTKQWFRVFDPLLGKDRKDDRGWAFELMGVRKKNKHLAASDHASDFTWRALDTMYRLAEPIDGSAAAELLNLRSSVDLSSFGHSDSVRAMATQESTVRDEPTLSPTGSRDQVSAQADLELEVVGPNFSGADLQRMNFAGVILSGADFEGADLTGANLKGAKLIGANFKGATLADADLTTADLTGAHFEDTTLSAHFDKERTTYSKPQYHGADLAGATLNEATLNFAGSRLRNVNFGPANLEGADFEGADLTGANLKGAKLRGVNLRNTNIRDADTTDVQWT